MTCNECRYFVNTFYGGRGVKWGYCARPRYPNAEYKIHRYSNNQCERFIVTNALKDDLRRKNNAGGKIYQSETKTQNRGKI